MKTVFITCFTGLISRNILATEALAILRRERGVQIVIIAPESRAHALTQEFAGESVVVEGVPMPPLSGTDHWWWLLATQLLHSRTREVQRIAKWQREKNIADYLFSRVVGFFGRFRLIRSAFRKLAQPLIKTAEFTSLFDRYRPAALFATDVYTAQDVKLAKLARARGVKVIGMVRSWDNVTSKTLLMFIPDFLLVNAERIKEMAVRFGDIPPERITAIGIPHYDSYRAEGRTPREEFFKRFGLDPAKKLILFTPPSDTYLKRDPVTPVVLKALAHVPAQVLVRLPLVGQTELGDYTLSSNVVFDRPANSPDFTEVHLNRDADKHLADSIFHSDIVITWASTMIIDAAVFGKPIVLVGFDATPRPYGESITQYYDYDHQRMIIESGGVKLAKNPEELTRDVEAYLENPKLDEQERRQIARDHCGELDGKAGERLAQFLLAHL